MTIQQRKPMTFDGNQRWGRLLFSGGIWPSSEPPGRVLLVGGTYRYTKLSATGSIFFWWVRGVSPYVTRHPGPTRHTASESWKKGDFGGRPTVMATHAETPLSVPYKLLCSRSCLPSWPWGSIQTSAGGQADPCLFSASSTRSQQAANLFWNGEMLNGEKVGLQIARGAWFCFFWEIFNLKLTFYRAFSRLKWKPWIHLGQHVVNRRVIWLVGRWPAGMLLCICMALDSTDTSSSLVFNFRSLKSRWNWWNHARNNARGPGVFFFYS